MQYSYSAHAERRLIQRQLTKAEVQQAFWAAEKRPVHDGLVAADAWIGGLAVRVVARKVKGGWFIVTVHFID